MKTTNYRWPNSARTLFTALLLHSCVGNEYIAPLAMQGAKTKIRETESNLNTAVPSAENCITTFDVERGTQQLATPATQGQSLAQSHAETTSFQQVKRTLEEIESLIEKGKSEGTLNYDSLSDDIALQSEELQEAIQRLRDDWTKLLMDQDTKSTQNAEAIKAALSTKHQEMLMKLSAENKGLGKLFSHLLDGLQRSVMQKIDNAQKSQLTEEDLRRILKEDRDARRTSEEERKKRKDVKRNAEAEKFQVQALQTLRAHYKRHYATIPSFFPGDAPWPIDDSYIQLAIVERAEVKRLEKKKEQPGRGDDKRGKGGKRDRDEDVKDEDKQEEKDQIRDQLLESYESIHAIKKDIKLEELFKARKLRDGKEGVPKKILLVGRAGIGKTTLCHKLAHLWASGKWYNDKFEAVYILPIRNLKKEKYNGTDLRSQRNLETAIAQECCNGAALDKEEFAQLTEHIKDQLKHRSEKVLIVLDGLDERSGASDEIIDQAKNRGKQASRLWVSRPYGVEEERREVERDKEALLVENIGFNTNQVTAYIKTYFQDEKQGQALLNFLQKQASIRGIAHIPINLQILCALWSDTEHEETFQKAASGSMIGLYDALCDYVWKRYKARAVTSPKKDDKEILYQVLGKIALEGLQKGELLIGSQVVDRAIDSMDYKEDALRTLLKASGFLRETESKERYFLHLTFQEYFAGRALACLLLSAKEEEQKEAIAFLHTNQFKSQFRVMLLFMAGEIGKQAGEKGMERLLALLQEAPEGEIVGFQNLLLQLRCMNELVGAGDTSVAQLERKYGLTKQLTAWAEQGIKYIQKDSDDTSLHEAVVGSFPRVRHLLASVTQVYLKASGDFRKDRDGSDKSYNVRSAAASALGALAQASPSQAPKALEALLKAAGDAEWHVREAAASALGALVQAAPSQAPKALEALVKAAGDAIDYVRYAAAGALGALAKAAPSQATLAALVKVAGDAEWRVRYAAAGALGELAQAAPSLAPKALELLVKAAGDERSDVREAAASALGALVKAAPSLASKALAALVKATGDENRYVRYTAASALGKLAQAVPSQATLAALVKAAGDKEYWVRRAAASALGELAKAVPSQATLAALVRAAGDADSDVREAAASALGKLAQAAPSQAPKALEALIKAVGDANEYVRSAAAGALGELAKAAPSQAPKALEALFKAVGSDSYGNGSIVRVLGELAQAAPSQAPKALEALVKVAGNADRFVRQVAARTLVALAKAAPSQASKALEALVKAAGDADRFVREVAASALGALVQAFPSQASKALAALVKAAEGDAHGRVRLVAARALGELAQAAPSQATLEALIKAAGADRNDKYDSARFAAARALGKLAKASPSLAPKTLETLLKAAGDDYSAVRKAAARALGELAKAALSLAPKALEVLLKAAGDADSDVREAAALALGALAQAAPSLATFEALVKAAGNSDSDVRYAAARALGELAKASPSLAPKTLEALVKAAGDGKSWVREAAARALGNFSAQQLVEGYCGGARSSSVVRYIMDKLYAQPLVIGLGKDARHYQLTLYQNTGKPIEWEAPKREIDRLKRAIKGQCPGGGVCVIQ